jgi:hypothetical protein
MMGERYTYAAWGMKNPKLMEVLLYDISVGGRNKHEDI